MQIEKNNNQDTSVIEETTHLYPSPQCRFGKYFTTSLFEKDMKHKPYYKDQTQGTCNWRNRDLAHPRPLCWLKQQSYKVSS